MTGYVEIKKPEFLALMESARKKLDIEVMVVNGGQQTRAIQNAMASNNKVNRFRSNPVNFPVVTLYMAHLLWPEDFDNVRHFLQCFSNLMYCVFMSHALCG